MHEGQQEFPVVKIVDNVFSLALSKSASDIHFEPDAARLRVRLRIDGVLYDHEPVDVAFMHQILSRIKVLANINIAEKRVPQDGKFRLAFNQQEIDLRVSTFPTVFGEKIVVRILDRAHYTISLDKLGFQDTVYEQILSLLSKSSGFFLVCGPTGSGKTTTLYGALSYLNNPQKNIITLEDPIEYCIQGITQGQIHPDAGFTFEKGMRALLRQDPDIVMVGEIRDKQTARIAIEAALTGHLVFSTIHTNDATSVIMRLMDMGIEPFLINAAITGILSQRLARKICVHCKIERAPDDHEQALLKKFNYSAPTLFEGKGCNYCAGLGFAGRIGIFELLPMSSGLRSLIVQFPSLERIYTQAIEQGMQPLIADGLLKMQQGIISIKELARVL